LYQQSIQGQQLHIQVTALTMLSGKAQTAQAATQAPHTIAFGIKQRLSSHIRGLRHCQTSSSSTSSRLGHHTRVHFKAEKQQQDSVQGSSSMQGWEPLQRFDHWSTLLTTMPGLNAR
jgi:hypothetical protein